MAMNPERLSNSTKITLSCISLIGTISFIFLVSLLSEGSLIPGPVIFLFTSLICLIGILWLPLSKKHMILIYLIILGIIWVLKSKLNESYWFASIVLCVNIIFLEAVLVILSSRVDRL